MPSGWNVTLDCNAIPDGLLDELDFQLIFIVLLHAGLLWNTSFCDLLNRTFRKDHELLILQNILPSCSENDARRMANITKYIVAAKVKVFE